MNYHIPSFSDELDKFALIIRVNKEQENSVRSAFLPLLRWIDGSNRIIHVTSTLGGIENEMVVKPHRLSGDGKKAEIPAINIMLFLPEYGHVCCQDMHKILLQPPWMFHHKIELANARAPRFSVAKQEYYTYMEGLPLWSVNPVHKGNEHLRICIFTTNFYEMVEFYRVITEREMESSKPGFCTFVLFSIGNLDVQLTIKSSPNIHPVSLNSVVIYLKIKDARTLYPLCENNIHGYEGNIYKLTDPDGNLVVLHHNSKPFTQLPQPSCILNKYTPKHSDSNSESQDSGRWSSTKSVEVPGQRSIDQLGNCHGHVSSSQITQGSPSVRKTENQEIWL